MIFFFPFAFTFAVCFASFTFVAVVFCFFAVVAGFVAGLAAVVLSDVEGVTAFLETVKL